MFFWYIALDYTHSLEIFSETVLVQEFISMRGIESATSISILMRFSNVDIDILAKLLFPAHEIQDYHWLKVRMLFNKMFCVVLHYFDIFLFTLSSSSAIYFSRYTKAETIMIPTTIEIVQSITPPLKIFSINIIVLIITHTINLSQIA